jgi:methylated-DNA-protein-cysteine methyltransferase-like protein
MVLDHAAPAPETTKPTERDLRASVRRATTLLSDDASLDSRPRKKGRARYHPAVRAAPKGWSEFYRVARRVPRGRVTTYGLVALAAGRPRSARHVGFALAALRGTVHDVPWHRVLGARGRGFAAISIRDAVGAAAQRELLEREGIAFDARGRVDLGRFGAAARRRPASRPEKSGGKGATSGGWRVYLLRCGDGSLYAGVTNDLPRRLAQHAAGTGARYTRSHLPVTLVYDEPARSRGEALRREAAIRRLTREQKQALVGTGKASPKTTTPRARS